MTKHLTPQKSETWEICRFKDKTCVDDIVYFWQAGQESGLYGWGIVNGLPESYRNDNYRDVSINCRVKFEKPIRKDELTNHPMLSDLAIIKAPQGTNFQLSIPEVQAVNDVIKKAGYGVPDGLENFKSAENDNKAKKDR